MKISFNKIKNNKGFSLIELMVAVALIVILTSIIITTANFSETQKNLTLARNELQANLRLAQSYSLLIPDQGISNICGFGLRIIDDENYAIYYTYDNDLTTSPSCNEAGLQDPSLMGTTNDLQKVNLDKAKTEITVGGADYIFFQAPYGKVNTGSIVLTSSGGSAGFRTVTVSSQGKIN